MTGIGDVRPGDDLAALITAAAPWLVDGDVLVVTSKVVSKAEGRVVAVPPEGPAQDAAREAILAAETARPVARRGPTRIVQTHHGFVMASAGIDASNVERGRLVLLPVDPDASARDLRRALRQRYRLDVAVVITDTMGRPWRVGLVDVAVGAAGIEPVADYRGRFDAYGNELSVTQTAVIDELAAAAELVKGKLGGVPVAVVRGLPRPGGADSPAADGPGAAALVRDAESDLFSLGTAEATALGLRRAASIDDAEFFGEAEVDSAVLDHALRAAPFPRVTDERVLDKLRGVVPANTAAVLAPAAPGEAWALAEAGAAVQRVRATLAAEGLATAWVPVEAATMAGLVPPGPGLTPLGLLAVGHP